MGPIEHKSNLSVNNVWKLFLKHVWINVGSIVICHFDINSLNLIVRSSYHKKVMSLNY